MHDFQVAGIHNARTQECYITYIVTSWEIVNTLSTKLFHGILEIVNQEGKSLTATK